MIIRGKLYAESPIYRGNARKTLFTRDGDGTQRLVSLAGEVSGTAQALMDAFIGSSKNKSNIGLINRLWLRLYNVPMPDNLIFRAECQLRPECYPKDHFFDLRMGVQLDEDRGAVIAGANYKMETLFRNAVFDLSLNINDAAARSADTSARLYHLLREIESGRFWFGAGKSKGLGRCRLELETKLPEISALPSLADDANHLSLYFSFSSADPILVGWNWGKIDPATPAFTAVDGRMLVLGMRTLPEAVRQRLGMALGGPILNAQDWKKKFSVALPRAILAWLRESTAKATPTWQFPSVAIEKMRKGKFPLSNKIVTLITPILDKPFVSQEAAVDAFNGILGPQEAKKSKRVLECLQSGQTHQRGFPEDQWKEVAEIFGFTQNLSEQLQDGTKNEQQIVTLMAEACQTALPALFLQVDQQIQLLQSDTWLDAEVDIRSEHLRIKEMLMSGEIDESQWGNPRTPPKGIKVAAWQGFLNDHRRVQYHHMLNVSNLNKSIVNDKNVITFLKGYRAQTQQELSQPDHIDFRAGGVNGREVSKKYGKPYDTVFMRMLSWGPSADAGRWEIYIPGATIKGAFRKRATQFLRTLWGETAKTSIALTRLFGAQRERGLLLFSDAYPQKQEVSKRVWCSMDGVKMDAKTGKPLEQAKTDYLFAYGDELEFQLRIDLQDIKDGDWEVLSILGHLVRDFMSGDIPFGGNKNGGLGWVHGKLKQIDWRASGKSALGQRMFGQQHTSQDGIWHVANWRDEDAVKAINALVAMQPQRKRLGLQPKGSDDAAKNSGTPQPMIPYRTRDGFISHRAFSGYCGALVVEGEVLTPIHICQSGEPSYVSLCQGEQVSGWDFFSVASPETIHRPENKEYALPSKSLRGMIRHIYTIASNSGKSGTSLNSLNAAEQLFGWVGNGPDQALMGRLSFGFAKFKQPRFSWLKIPYPYGEWQYRHPKWERIKDASIKPTLFAGQWRIYPHAPPAPCITSLEEFQPDTFQAGYFRAILPGSVCRFTVRFVNMEKEELERLIWCIGLEKDLAHKMGKGRQLGLGSLRLRLLPESFLIDWQARYDASRPNVDGRNALFVDQWHNPKVINQYNELRQFLRVQTG
ncbi:MAG: hypothetical protein HQL78_11795 [Magnetococcales bacterium]|nr:hypothetical protein [Magnetococcales bacterium]